MTSDGILEKLKAMSDPNAVSGMSRFGINPRNTLGVPIPKLRGLARLAGKDHALALELWGSGLHEARILASLVDEPGRVSAGQVDRWISDFDSWDVCDQVMMNLFWTLPASGQIALKYCRAEGEYAKRAGFALMAVMAVKDKKAKDSVFEEFLAEIASYSGDDRNYVRKSVNWALRQIGKRNARLNRKAIAVARKLIEKGDRSSKWIGSDAMRELVSQNVKKRIQVK